MSKSRRLAPLSWEELRQRERRIASVARRLGFIGTTEYRHEASASGGAQYRMRATPAEDRLIVYEDAFARDLNPEDFSLEAMMAHERGHQLLHRHTKLKRFVRIEISRSTEEIMASLIGSLLVKHDADEDALLLKAAWEAVQWGMDKDRALAFVDELRNTLEGIL